MSAAHQARDTGVDVHHGAAGEVQRAHLEEEAFGAPDHARDRQVGEGEPEHHEDQHRRELGAFGEGADRQCSGDGREGRLEHDEHELRNHHALREGRGVGVGREAGHQEPARVTPPRTRAVEGEAVAVDDPQHGAAARR